MIYFISIPFLKLKIIVIELESNWNIDIFDVDKIVVNKITIKTSLLVLEIINKIVDIINRLDIKFFKHNLDWNNLEKAIKRIQFKENKKLSLRDVDKKVNKDKLKEK